MKDKGIETAINAVKQANELLGYTAYSLDIYGQIDSLQTEWFENLKKVFPSYIRYGGVIAYEKSVEVLKQYFALLFPTYYEGEGFAGTIIDAIASGVPVIASNWKYNSEIVNKNVGFIYSVNELEELVGMLKDIAANPTLLLNKKKYCLIEAEKYKIDNVATVLLDNLG